MLSQVPLYSTHIRPLTFQNFANELHRRVVGQDAAVRAFFYLFVYLSYVFIHFTYLSIYLLIYLCSALSVKMRQSVLWLMLFSVLVR